MTSEMNRKSFLKLMGLGVVTAATTKKTMASTLSHLQSDEVMFYVGTYTTGKSKGIYRCTFSPSTGNISMEGFTEGIVNPSFLTIAPDNKYLYAVSETDKYEGETSGSVDAYKIDTGTGGLEHLNKRPSHGAAPCFIITSNDGRYVMVANYNSGNLAVFPVAKDGSLGRITDLVQHHGSGVNPERQEGPHAHSIVLDPANKFALSCDLGTDKVMIYKFDHEHGKLITASQPFAKVKPGLGPRHVKFHPSGRIVYVICEMGNTMLVFDYNPENGHLKQKQLISTLPSDFHGTTDAAELQISSDGRFLYGSNRGADSIVVYSINQKSGEITPVQYQSTLGKFPRHFILDPTEKYLIAANEHTNNVVVFNRDQNSGKITPAGKSIDIPDPVCIKFL